jgi:hypothetical protein
MGLNKIVELDEHFSGSRGLEPTVQLIDFNTKTASEASDWSRSIRPVPGKTYILVLAMGASEFYGPNRNGDAFRETELKKCHKTFETNAHVFKSHVNKDPEKSYGKVVKSFYNQDMHRVELVLEIDNNKAPDIVDKVNSGQTVAVSMGCRIKFDVCSICGNEAPTREDYCSHLRNELNEIYPDGRIVCADNPNPNFFDISIVWRPADRTGYMLKKIASARQVGNSSAWLAEKVAARKILKEYLSKAADIEKLVTGIGIPVETSYSGDGSNVTDSSLYSGWLKTVVPRLSGDYEALNDTDLLFLSTKELPKVLTTLSNMGIFLATPEFLDLIYLKASGKKAPEGLASKLIELQGDVFKMLSKHPELSEGLISKGLVQTGAESEDKSVAEKVSKYLPVRSLSEEWLRPTDARVKTSAKHIIRSSNFTLPRSTYSYPELNKLAQFSYATYIANLQELTTTQKYTKLASLVSPTADGRALHRTYMPWAPLTVSYINHSLKVYR